MNLLLTTFPAMPTHSHRPAPRALPRIAGVFLAGWIFAALPPAPAADAPPGQSAATTDLLPAEPRLSRCALEDRNGVGLFQPAEGKRAAAFPYRALAAQVLTSLPASIEAAARVKLTLDARVQTIAEEALRAVTRGAAVVLDAQTGDVLAMASVPSFDPIVLTEEIRTRFAADPTEPLRNRAVSAFAPGSTFKVVTALAGARKDLAGNRYTCAGGVTYGDKFLKCWIADKGGGHGMQALDEALKNSCSPYFYQYGNAAGIEEIVAMGTLLGLGARSGLPLTGEAPGLIPSFEWLRETSPTERWSQGYTANTANGQGFVLASPLQMARVAAAIGNGGRVPALRLILDAAPEPALDLHAHGVTDEALEIIRRGMRKVVTEGTGQRAKMPGIEVAGKTGTAQHWRGQEKDTHTWFIAYAPAEKPKLAVCVFVQGAKSGGGVAAPLAARIIERSLRAELPAPRVLEPAKGSFTPIEDVSD